MGTLKVKWNDFDSAVQLNLARTCFKAEWMEESESREDDAKVYC